jgi:stage II sporulation protein D
VKKIFIFTAVLLIIPFLIVTFLNFNYEKNIKEISLNYVSNVVVRVYRSNSDTIENVMLEEYVVGVVAGEMPVSFDIEALKAQAVAARTYAIDKIIDNALNDYDVVDTVMDQVYLDLDTLKSSWGDNYVSYINKVRESVNETSMEYLDYNGEVIRAMYFSTSNGYTEDYNIIFGGDIPYLTSVESFWDSDVSSVFNDSVSMSLADFYSDLNLSYNKDLSISNVIRSDTNRVISLSINGTLFTGRELYNKLGLRSYDFDISLVGSNVVIETIGYGHGVGMSQYGAYGMALDGYSYDEILSHYYTGTSLKKWEI